MKESIVIERLEAYGAKRWQSGDDDRLYFSEQVKRDALQLELLFYGTGNVSKAYLRGDAISNREGRRLMNALRETRAYLDLKTGEIASHTRHAKLSVLFDNELTALMTGLRDYLNEMRELRVWFFVEQPYEFLDGVDHLDEYHLSDTQDAYYQAVANELTGQSDTEYRVTLASLRRSIDTTGWFIANDSDATKEVAGRVFEDGQFWIRKESTIA